MEQLTTTRPSISDANLEQLLSYIKAGMIGLEQEYSAMQKELALLEQLPRTKATLHWREDKYLYLLHPVTNGTRKREYIGTDPQKIAAAKDRLSRWDEHETLTRSTHNKKWEIRSAQDAIQALARQLIKHSAYTA